MFATHHGNDVVTEFSADFSTDDVIEFRGLSNATSLGDVQISATFNGSDTVIALSDFDSVTLLGISPTDLDSCDLLFN